MVTELKILLIIQRTILSFLFCFFSLWSFGQENKRAIEYKKDKDCAYYYDDSLKVDIYSTVDQNPEYPNGGDSGFQSFILQRVCLPKELRAEALLSRPRFIFIIGEDGKIIFYSVRNQNWEENEKMTPLENEIIRLLDQTIDWIPAKCNGKDVAKQVLFEFRMPRVRN